MTSRRIHKAPPFETGSLPWPGRRLEIYRALSAVIDSADRWLVVHSSLPELRLAPQGLKWDLLAALVMLVREGRTIALPTFTFTFCRGHGFHDRDSAGETGQLGNWFLELNDTRRTRHPIYSFAVAGSDADELLAADNATTFGDDSSFALFERHDARIIMLGCDWTACTQFHRYEEEAHVPYRRYHDFVGTVDIGNGPVRQAARMYVRDEQIGAVNDFGPAIEHLRSQGNVASAVLGEGRVESVRCSALAAACRELLTGNPWVFARLPSTSAARDGGALSIPRSAPRALSAGPNGSQAPPLRIALLGHSNLELICSAMREFAGEYSAGQSVEIHQVAFGQLMPQMLNLGSELHRFGADVVMFVDRLEDIFQVGRLDELRDRPDVDEALADFLAGVERFVSRHDACVFLQRFTQFHPSSNGVFDATDEGGAAALVDRSNRRLAGFVKKHPALRLFDLAPWAAAFGEGPVYDSRLWHLGRFPFSAAFSRALGRRYWGLTLAALGRTARLLVLDLDGTLWGGVLGEDGLDGLQLGGDYPGNAYLEFQRSLKRLTERGIALALASKNDEADALAVVRGLAGMALGEGDFVAHRINWRPKPDNIIEIADELGLGLEHVLFIDDNPAERETMRRSQPEVKVLELPDDPALYCDALLRCPYLECVEVTQEDTRRIGDYQGRGGAGSSYRRGARQQARRVEPSLAATPDNSLWSLAVEVHLEPLTAENAVRAEQLMQKTNQFNTTTRRYRRGRLTQLQAEGSGVYVIAACDRFREQENIGVLIVHWNQPEAGSAEIDSLLLSCRVLGRGIETAVLAWLCQEAAARSIERLIAPVIITERNQPVRDVFQRHGFEPTDTRDIWRLDLTRARVEAPAGIKIFDHCPAAV